ncbi:MULTISPECIES: hypothetical protein [Bacillus cereus group]|uniref:hypothetical protein n=1 Tax=Bacillus cereus group TaxID=86661 RepID=UPI000BF12B95|nr:MULTISPECIES: hypothetical protein [Bacillus cereus group]PEO28684.1 hypothetical protein CN589_14020 [Bacillus toyonensis]PFY01392.1 hypothetical protein COL45_17675 [Bacillus toyonensis]PGM15575.1 hypothetical protein CN938_11160 [Bacillus thuringiensis]PHB83475.1 hypothetical protein COE93_04165 [Bacillus toyonensis]
MTNINANENQNLYGSIVGGIEINGKQLLLVEKIQQAHNRGISEGTPETECPLGKSCKFYV